MKDGQHLLGRARARELDRALGDHRAGVDAGVDEMDGHAEDLHAIRKRLLDRTKPREGGQERGMHIDDRARKAREEDISEQLHVAREHDEARAAPEQPVAECAVALLARGVLRGGKHRRRDSARAGALERRDLGHVRGDRDDLGLARVDRVEKRLQVGARARDEHRDGKGRFHARKR